MKMSVSTLLDVTPERMWEEIQRPEILQYVAEPLVSFDSIDPESFPERWEEDEYQVVMRLFGVVPLGTQWIRISKPRIEDTDGGQFYQIRDNGTGQLVSTWDHLISIRETADGKTVYTDEVEIDAGILTPLIWLFASVFYRHRQRRWRKLVANGFTR